MGAKIDGVYYCPHEKLPPCSCRKPEPGMLFIAAREHQVDLGASWMIGDSEIDIEAGKRAGCRTAKILGSHLSSLPHTSADIPVQSLLEGAHQILRLEEPTVDRSWFDAVRNR
jgi:D-glycero-D-manno-heptose 1,7-bisphosphate phosphatase